MKKLVLAVLFGLLHYTANGQDSTSSPQQAFIIKLELLKVAGVIDNPGYTIEPEFSYHRNRFVYNITFGISKINNTIYQELDYTNKGNYLQAGVQFNLSEQMDRNTDGVFIGFHVNAADHEETGRVLFSGSYFEDFVGELVQDHITYSAGWLMSYKEVMGKRLAVDLTFRLSRILNTFDQPEFPVYYVPGAGITNIFGDRENNHRTTIGMSFKIGYKF